jgi:hypothetical protein
MTIAEMFKRELLLAEAFGYDERTDDNSALRVINTQIRNERKGTAYVPVNENQTKEIHIFSDESWLDDETYETGTSTVTFTRDHEGKLWAHSKGDGNN